MTIVKNKPVKVSKSSNKSKAKKVTAAIKKQKKSKVTQVNIALVVDASGSMQTLRTHVLNAINTNFLKIKEEARKSRIPTRISLFTFNNRVSNHLLNENVAGLSELDVRSYNPCGGTALYDGISKAVTDLNSLSEDTDANVVIVITDGEENASSLSKEGVVDIIQACIADGNWTISVAGPKSIWNQPIGRISELVECITVWEGTKESIELLATRTSGGISKVYGNATRGVSSTMDFYHQPKVEGLTKKEVKAALETVTSKFVKIRVPSGNEDLRIKQTVEREGYVYEAGNGYYQLTKREEVQSYKDLIVENRATGELFAGSDDDVRELLGIPAGEIKLNPTFNDKFTVYVKSTSWTRKLITGTTLLFRIK